MNGVAFDAGGLIAVDRGDRLVLALLARAAERGMRVTIPATAFAQAVRSPARQVRVMRLARQSSTDVVPLDVRDAIATGLLLAASGTSDIVDAHVVVCARRTGQVLVTSDAPDICRLDPTLKLLAV
jgi:hypothetical protein